MKNDQIKKADGLPEIAQRLQQKKPMVLIMLGVICVACGSLFFVSKPKKPVAPALEETYTVQPVVQNASNNQSVSMTHQYTAQNNSPDPAVLQEQLALIQAKKDELKQRLSAPLMLVNNAQPDNTASIEKPPAATDANTQLMHQVSAQATETVNATTIGSLNTILAEGTMIDAILESATNSDLPGYVRAIVSQPNYSEDGSQILIPRGSRLIGQYKSGMLQGQSRIFMVWTRLIMPGGISIQLGSPSVDQLGVSGMEADQIDRHFWERFSMGSLLSIIGAGAANVSVTSTDQDNSAAMYRSAVANSFAQSANQSLQQDNHIPPTLKKYQGMPIKVFVAKDLNFQTVLKQSQTSRNVF